MEKDLEVRPYVVQTRYARPFHHATKHGHEPRRNARYARDIAMDGIFDQQRQLLCPVGHKRHVLAGHTHEID